MFQFRAVGTAEKCPVLPNCFDSATLKKQAAFHLESDINHWSLCGENRLICVSLAYSPELRVTSEDWVASEGLFWH
jgi:hypothetical protein